VAGADIVDTTVSITAMEEDTMGAITVIGRSMDLAKDSQTSILQMNAVLSREGDITAGTVSTSLIGNVGTTPTSPLHGRPTAPDIIGIMGITRLPRMLKSWTSLYNIFNKASANTKRYPHFRS
jgi:hypothetical protein